MKKITFIIHNIFDRENKEGYRVHQYFPYLEQKGFAVSLFTTRANFLDVLRHVARSDVTLVQRVLLSPLKLALVRRFSKRMVYDFDDAVMLGSKGKSATRAARFERTVKCADAVMCGNRFLLGEAAKLRTEGLHYVPTVVDTDEYPVKVHDASAPFTLGWIGSSSTLRYLMEIKDLLADLSASKVNVKVIADRPAPIEGLVFERWQKDREKAALLSLDAGIMPVGNDLWSVGKCGLKLIQYMASGLPSITHPVGAATEIMTNGVEGFLRADADGWKAAIEELAGDVNLREKMGRAARATVEERYSLKVWGPRVAEIVAGL